MRANVLIPSTTLNNGVRMPMLAVGTGGQVHMLNLSLSLGFTHVDTSEKYTDFELVGRTLHRFQVPSRLLLANLEARPDGGTVKDCRVPAFGQGLLSDGAGRNEVAYETTRWSPA